jgi:hypothetical protein
MKQIKLYGRGAVGDYACALVDDEFYPFLNRFKWYAKPMNKTSEKMYAVTGIWVGGKQQQVYMHCLVKNIAPTKVIDHLDGLTNNNQLHNLDPKTRKDNAQQIHSSVFKGCDYDERWRVWWCRIRVDGEQIGRGTYDTETDCAIAYNHARLEFFPNAHESTFNDIPNWRNITPTPHVKRRYIYKSNTSGVPGVSWNKRNKCWNVSIGLRRVGIEGGKARKSLYIGSYRDRLEAIAARRDAEIKYLGHTDINLDDFRDGQ